MKSDREEKYLEATLDLLKQSQQGTGKYTISMMGREFIVHQGVFSPKYFRDTEFFAKNISIKKGGRFCEIGCGTGIISTMAALNGAYVTAIDISTRARKNTWENARRHHVADRICVYRGDVYSSLEKEDKFDTIFWNVPFIYNLNKTTTVLEKSVLSHRYKDIDKYLREGRFHLNARGKLLIGFSTTLGNYEKLQAIVHKNRFSLSCVKQAEIDYGPPIGRISLEIYQAREK